MKKKQFIEKYGIEQYERTLEQRRAWAQRNPEKVKACGAAWRTGNPESVKTHNAKSNKEKNRKGGKYYEKKMKYMVTGIQGERNVIRHKHGKLYAPFKRVIAPETQLHHQWLPGTVNYTGVALVEAVQHRHGYIDVIHILEGKITLFTEKEIRNQRYDLNGEVILQNLSVGNVKTETGGTL